jgi:hypothetical protein
MHLGSMIFGVLIAPWIYRMMHHKKKRPRPIGKHSPLRGMTYRQAMTTMTAARIFGYVAMFIFVIYLGLTLARIS